MSEHIKFKETETSAIESVNYDENEVEMIIKFRDGRSYKYYNVPPMIFKNFINSSVKSKFFNNIIRGYYEYKRL